MKATFTFSDKSTMGFRYPQSPRGLRIAGERPISVEFTEGRTNLTSDEKYKRSVWKMKCELACQSISKSTQMTPKEQDMISVRFQALAWDVIFKHCKSKLKQDKSDIDAVLNYIRELEVKNVNQAQADAWITVFQYCLPNLPQSTMCGRDSIISYIKNLETENTETIRRSNEAISNLSKEVTRLEKALNEPYLAIDYLKTFILKLQDDNGKLVKLLNESEMNLVKSKAQRDTAYGFGSADDMPPWMN